MLYALMLWEQGQIGVADFVMAVSLSLLIINEARNLSRRFLELTAGSQPIRGADKEHRPAGDEAAQQHIDPHQQGYRH